MAKVKFWRGVVAGYNETTHANGIYFATDKKEIWLNGQAYGGTAAEAEALKKAIVKAEYTDATETTAATIKLTAKDGSTSTITLPSVAAGNGISVTTGTNGAYTVAVNLDTTNNKLAKVTTNGLAVSASLNWNKTDKKVELKDADGTVVSEIDASDFVKDGILDSVQFGKYADDSTSDDALIFTWNTDAGKDATKIKLTDIFNPYIISNGLVLDASNKLSVKVKEGDKYITVDTDGIHATDLVATIDASTVANQTAIATLNGDKETTGSVAKAVYDASTELIGTATDASTADTIKGAKAYADALASDLDGKIDALDASLVGGAGKFIQSIEENDGIITAIEATLDASAVAFTAETPEGAVQDDSTTVDAELRFLKTQIIDNEKVAADAITQLNEDLEWNDVTVPTT